MPKLSPVRPVEENEYKISRKIIKQEPQLDYQINGTIINDKSKLVIFEDKTNNKTLFLREGQVYNGLKITLISVDKIRLVEKGKKKEIFVGK